MEKETDVNDPHVVALNYRIDHSSSVGYDNAAPLDHSEEAFDIHVEDGRVRFVMKRHHATESEAVEAVEDYIRAWERFAALQNGPNEFTLVFAGAEIKDRDPKPGIKYGSAMFVSGRPSFNIVGRVLKAAYPQPPSRRLEFNPDIDSMYHRYIGYRTGREPLPSMAYFCLTVLEDSVQAGKDRRRVAARHYGIDYGVLSEIGRLCANKGGTEARKSKGVDEDLSEQERQFLENAVKEIIIRAAEVAGDPNGSCRPDGHGNGLNESTTDCSKIELFFQ